MFGQMKIKTKILAILAVLAGGYLLLLAMVQISATATHSRMLEISSSLFPAALQIQEAETSFERMKKHYGDAVVLQDAAALKGAGTDAEATGAALEKVKALLASSPELSKQANDLLTQFSSLRSRDHDTYAAILAATGGPSDELMGQVGALGKDNKALSDAMIPFDKAISANFHSFFPETREVYLIGTFTDWEQRPIPLTRLTDGNWFVQMQLYPGHYHHAFAIDGKVQLNPQASGTIARPRFHRLSILSIS